MMVSLEASQELTVKNGGNLKKSVNYYFIDNIKNPQIDIDFKVPIFSTKDIGTFTNQEILLCTNDLVVVLSMWVRVISHFIPKQSLVHLNHLSVV